MENILISQAPEWHLKADRVSVDHRRQTHLTLENSRFPSSRSATRLKPNQC